MMNYTPLSLLLLICFNVNAQQADTSKAQYSIFKPTPRNKMREMQTDRPDVTESAYTVDAGHFQYEADAFKLVRNKADGIKLTQYLYNAANLKLGITNTTDLQLVIESYVQEKVKDYAGRQLESSSGFGDMALRIKQNLLGNDQGKAALALMPYINLPTSKTADKGIEGGIIVPFALELNKNWSFGSQIEADLLKNEENSKYHAELINSFTISRAWTDMLDTFAETYYNYNFKDSEIQVYLNGGLACSLTDNLKLDAGLNYGLTKGADKVYFVGFSFRY